MTRTFYRLAFIFAFIALGATSLRAEVVKLQRGHEKRIVLTENPSTGYSWKIDEDGSENLSLLAIIDHGHKRGAAMPGAPGERSWTLRAKSAGRAVMQIVYQRPWEPAPVETRRFDIVIP
jgi:inhibitor of cysteine peptidase